MSTRQKRLAGVLQALCAAAGVLLTVSGCGGGNGGAASAPSAPTTTPTAPTTPTRPAATPPLAGKVIDGYVSGATVWLDINGNHIKDADEPSTVSKAAGNYQLELSESQRACLPYATLYVDVPVGAIDEDSGPVKNAYQMAIAPQFQPISVDQVLNVSPLTTAIWDQVRTRLTASGPNLGSCEQLRQDQQLRAAMVSEIKDVMEGLVRRHNLSEARIHADFIQAKDSQSHLLAQDIVKGLKAGYAYKQQLQAQYPDATYVRSEIYRGRGQGLNDRAGVWYRSASVWRPAGYANEWVELDDSLSKIQRVLNLRRQDSQPWGSATLSTTRTAYNFENDGSDYFCAINEAVTKLKDGATYELVVHYKDPQREADPLACFNASHATPGAVSQREYYMGYAQGRVSYLGNLRFDAQQPEFARLEAWGSLKGKSQQLDFNDVIQRIAGSGIRFDEDVQLATTSWNKRRTDDTSLRVMLEKTSTGPWTRVTTQSDGTSRKECSTDQGKSWSTCSS